MHRNRARQCSAEAPGSPLGCAAVPSVTTVGPEGHTMAMSVGRHPTHPNPQARLHHPATPTPPPTPLHPPALTTQLHAIWQHLGDAPHHGQQQRLLHILMPVNLCRRGQGTDHGTKPVTTNPLQAEQQAACVEGGCMKLRRPRIPQPLATGTHPARWSRPGVSRCLPPRSSARWRRAAPRSAPSPGSSACSASPT